MCIKLESTPRYACIYACRYLGIEVIDERDAFLDATLLNGLANLHTLSNLIETDARYLIHWYHRRQVSIIVSSLLLSLS